MSIVQALRACAGSLGLTAATVLAVLPGAPAAAVESRIGVDRIEFSWEEAAGDPPYYAVWLTRRDSTFKAHDLVEDNRVVVDVAPGDRVAIYVHGVRPHPDGGWQIGPASEPSPTVYVLGTHPFPHAEDGLWLSHCALCRDAVQRDLADASQMTPQFSALWQYSVVSVADFADGTRWLVWQHRDTGALLLSNLDDPKARLIGPMPAPPQVFAGTADIAGDGEEEFLFVDPSSGNRLDRYTVVDGALEWVTSTPGMAGGELGPIADYTGDGRDDLLWLQRDRELVAVWSFGDFDAQRRLWTFRDSYLLDVIPTEGYDVVAAADYDGNGEVDLLWRGAEGDLWVNYVADGAIDRIRRVAPLPGDENLEVIGSPEVDAVPGAEIALRDVDSGRVWIAYPAVSGYAAREAVLDPGASYETIYIGP